MVTTDAMIRLEEVGMRWDGRVALENVSFEINKGDFVAITGPNGGGKTTLLRIILKLLHPTAGSVSYYDNGAVTDRLDIGYLPQKNMIDSRFPIDVRQVISSGLLAVRSIDETERQARVDDMLGVVGLSELQHNSIGELSGGQLQRALLGRALISRPSVIVLDEPLSYIDKRFEDHIYEILSSLEKSTTILLVSHEITAIASMANRHLIVDRTVHECSAAHHYAARTPCDD